MPNSTVTQSRRGQIRYGDIAIDKQGVWLAGEVDDLETTMRDEMRALATEVKRLRQVLTGLLVSIILALIVVPVSVFIR